MEAWILIVSISLLVLAAQAIFILPERIKRKKEDKHGER